MFLYPPPSHPSLFPFTYAGPQRYYNFFFLLRLPSRPQCPVQLWVHSVPWGSTELLRHAPWHFSFSQFPTFLATQPLPVPTKLVDRVPPRSVPSALLAGGRGAHLPDVNISQGEAGEECAAPSPAQVINPQDWQVATGGLWLRLLGKSAQRKDFNSSSAQFVRAWRGAGCAATGPGKGQRSSRGRWSLPLRRQTPVGEALPLPKGKMRVIYFLRLQQRNLVNVFRVCLVLSASPPAPVLPSCCMEVFQLRWGLLTGASCWCGVSMNTGSGGT